MNPTTTMRTLPRAVTRWGRSPVAVILHWTLAVLLPTAVALGWYVMSVELDPSSDWCFDTYKSLGIRIALLVLVRLTWRLTHRIAACLRTFPRGKRGWPLGCSLRPTW